MSAGATSVALGYGANLRHESAEQVLDSISVVLAGLVEQAEDRNASVVWPTLELHFDQSWIEDSTLASTEMRVYPSIAGVNGAVIAVVNE